MHAKTIISLLVMTALISAGLFSTTGCANIIPPEGGPRDSLPPVPIRVVPADSTTRFEGNRIVITFNEYVKTDPSFQQAVMVSPFPRVPPTATYKLNTVTVRLKDTLEPNTTYSIYFGDAIKDENESIPFRNYTYIFSTGDYIDSLSFSGKVLLAENGRVDTTLYVMLHRNREDSAIVKEKPRYIAKLDGKGNFTFRNLPSDTFYLYAMKDDAKIFRYDPKRLFAFADSPVVMRSGTPPVTLYAYEMIKPSPSVSSNMQQDAGGGTRTNDRRLKFKTSVNGDKQDLLKPFAFQFEKRLRQFDSSKAVLYRDTTFTPVTGYSWTTDSTRHKVTLNYSFQEDTRYHLILQKDFATDSSGFQLLRPDTISFVTSKSADYGQLAIRFRNIKPELNPVIQFIANNEVQSSYPIGSGNLSLPLFPPGEYEMRILYDANKNGIWDPGDFFHGRKQPEMVKPIERKISIKPNWNNQFELIL